MSVGGEMEFAELYAVLGVTPEQGVQALQQAYRRYVARTHPDRPGDAAPGRLAEVTHAYARAIAFHRDNGRLPGSPAPHSTTSHAPVDAGTRTAPSPAVTGRPPLLRWLGWAAVLTLAWLLLPPARHDPPAVERTRRSSASPPAQGNGGKEQVVEIGMEAADVLAVQGPPTERREGLWSYGPSWIRFRCGRVQAWNSSPLRPLRVDAPSASDPLPAPPNCAVERRPGTPR